jgi:hypothetical protein
MRATVVSALSVALLLVCGWVAVAADQEVLPPSVTPVVVIQGTDYEMGYQYGQQAGQWIEKRAVIEWGTFARWGYTYEEMIRELKSAQYYTKKSAPECITQMEGIADGARAAGYDVSYLDVLLLNAAWIVRKVPTATATYPRAAEFEDVGEGECSLWVAYGSMTADGALICNDSDDMGVFDYGVVVVAFPETGNNYVTTCRPGELAQTPNMNSKGVFIGCSTGPASRPEDKDYGIPWMFARVHAIRFANTAVEAKNMIIAMDVASGLSLTIADTTPNALVLEITSAGYAVRKVGDNGEKDFIFASNNYLTKEMGPANAAPDWIEHIGWNKGSSVTRNQEMWDFLTNYPGKQSVDFAKMMWRFPGTEPPAAPAGGWKTQISNLGNERVAIMLPKNGPGGLTYLCTGNAARVVLPFSKGIYPIDPTHTFYELSLAENPQKVAESAYSAATKYIAAAYAKLMYLNYTDTGYEGLSALYSKAVAEYYEGYNAMNKAATLSAPESLLWYGRGTTLFANAQCHAQQVYEALEPPATTPEELGLQPWGYWVK